ncbi:uncharacterized protein METZ01_LOCUS356799, partial [marine metagenome]
KKIHSVTSENNILMQKAIIRFLQQTNNYIIDS